MSSISTLYFPITVTCHGTFVKLFNLKWASGQWDFNQIALRNKVERGNLTTTDTTAVDGQRSTSISPCFLLCNRRGLMIGPYCCGWWNYSWLILITIFISIIKDKEQGMGNSLLFTYYVVEWGRMSGSFPAVCLSLIIEIKMVININQLLFHQPQQYEPLMRPHSTI
jgi:hypothetical protein